MSAATFRGSVLTPARALAAVQFVLEDFIDTSLRPILISLSQGLSGVGVPTSYGVVEPDVLQGVWVNGFQWDESNTQTITRLILDLIRNANRNGIWVDFQTGLRGGNITPPSGPYGVKFEKDEDGALQTVPWFDLVSKELLASCFGQEKARVKGIWFATKLQLHKNKRRPDYRRFPLQRDLGKFFAG